jgi:hypothetical protein
MLLAAACAYGIQMREWEELLIKERVEAALRMTATATAAVTDPRHALQCKLIGMNSDFMYQYIEFVTDSSLSRQR